MILLAILASTSVIDAERAFAKLAQDKGQWTAFRATAAAEDAALEPVIFVPQPVNAQTWLKDRKDPPKSVEWWPTAAWVACNGFMGVTTGGALWPDGSHGYFTTVWTIDDPDRPQWRWIVDHGDALSVPRPRPVEPVIRKASCAPVHGYPQDPKLTVVLAPRNGYGASEKDLSYNYRVGADGGREVWVSLWNGSAFEVVLHDIVAARK